MAEKTARQTLIETTVLRLGGSTTPGYGTDLEIGPEHLDQAVSLALQTYRQRAENSVEEAYMIIELIKDQHEYVLPKEVRDVREIFRQGYGHSNSTATQIDPFALAYTNIYLLQGGGFGNLVTYEAYHHKMELAGKMFGMYPNFKFDSRTSKLYLMHKPRSSDEEVLLQTYNYVPEHLLIEDDFAGRWIQDWCVAEAKEMLGQVRSKFSQIAGPQGGTTLNGDALKAEAQQEKEQLRQEIRNFVDGSTPLMIVRA